MTSRNSNSPAVTKRTTKLHGPSRTEPPSAAPPPSGHTSRNYLAMRLALNATRIGPILILVLLCVALSIASPVFPTLGNLANIGTQSSVVAVLALGQFIVILTSGIDLSVGSVLSLTSVVGAIVASTFYLGNWGILAMLLVGAFIGFVNGIVLVKWKIPTPFIVTLGMLNAAGGLALILSNGNSIVGAPPFSNFIGTSTVFGLPVAVLFAAALSALVYVFTSRVQFGRWLYAIGGSMEGAKRVGIPVNATLVGAYIISGVFAGCAAIIASGRADAGYPTAGLTLELDAIAAVIIGGASFLGGRGNVLDVIVGALILGVIKNGLDLLNVPAAWQEVAIGTVLVLAIALDVLRGQLEKQARTARGKGEPQ